MSVASLCYFDISLQETGDYTFKTDVYSLGLMLYEMHHPVRSGTEKILVSVLQILKFAIFSLTVSTTHNLWYL